MHGSIMFAKTYVNWTDAKQMIQDIYHVPKDRFKKHALHILLFEKSMKNKNLLFPFVYCLE